MKCKRDSDGRAIDHRSLQVIRQQAVKAVMGGQSATTVAAAMGVNIRTVFRWLSDFAFGGQNALLAKAIPNPLNLSHLGAMRWIYKQDGDGA